MIEIPIILMNIAIIALCVSVICMRKYVKSVETYAAYRLNILWTDFNELHAQCMGYHDTVKFNSECIDSLSDRVYKHLLSPEEWGQINIIKKEMCTKNKLDIANGRIKSLAHILEEHSNYLVNLRKQND